MYFLLIEHKSIILCCVADPEHPPIKVGEFTEKIALLRANDDEGLEDEYSVRSGRERKMGRERVGGGGRELERRRGR